ncbi:hypothetical protein MRX96_054397 [Rhipicephalus microplus]
MPEPGTSNSWPVTAAAILTVQRIVFTPRDSVLTLCTSLRRVHGALTSVAVEKQSLVPASATLSVVRREWAVDHGSRRQLRQSSCRRSIGYSTADGKRNTARSSWWPCKQQLQHNVADDQQLREAPTR